MSSEDPLHTSLCRSIEPARVRGGNFVFGDKISSSDLLSRLAFFLSKIFILDGESLNVGDCDCLLYCMLGPGYMVTGCSLYGLSLKSLEKPMNGNIGGFSKLGDFLRANGTPWRGGSHDGVVSGRGGRTPC